MSTPISQFGLTCPSGGDFYICQGNSTQFLGCCTSDPCKDGKGNCPQSDLRASSFNESAYSDIKSQACGSSSAGEWYTCSTLDTPFLGCCSTNACSDGCATKDLLAARLSDNKKNAAAFEITAVMTATASITGVTSISQASSSSSSSSSSTSTSTSSAAATATTGTHIASSSGLSTGVKVGIAVGCVVLIAVLLVGLFVFGRRYLRKRRGVVVTGSPPSVLMSNPTNSYMYHDPNRILHTPPPLSSSFLEPFAAGGHTSRSPVERGTYSSPLPQSAMSSAGEANSAGFSPEQEEHTQQHLLLEPVAELPCSPPLSAHLRSHPPSMYRPYRPSMQEFQDPQSGLYP